MADVESELGQYNDGNRAFVQAFMARGSMTLKESRPVLAAVFAAEGNPTEPEDITQEDLDSYLVAATRALSPFDYEIRSAIHQVSGDRVYTFINSTSDPLTQVATTRTPEELTYIKRLLDAMFEKYNTPRAEIMGVTSMQALKAAKAPRPDARNDEEDVQSAQDKGLTNSQAEKALASLVSEGWLERSKEGWYTLTTRSLLELRSYLLTTYNDPDAESSDWQRIKNCEACKSIVTVGQRCTEIDCNVRLHDVCQSAFWRTRRERKCPKCRTDWDGRHWVGEKAITTTDAYLTGKRRSGKRQEIVEDEEVEDAEERRDEDDD